MAEYQIAVIMPVHNTGIYLEEALDSVFEQTFLNFELICVDDASEDDLTVELLEKYQLMYKNMKVIRLEQKVGAAKARNMGLALTEAEYVIFLDSDDIFCRDMLERMYERIKETECEVCFCGFRSFAVIGQEKLYSEERLPRAYESEPERRPEDWLTYNGKAPWNKLVRRDFLDKNHISFQTLSSSNDLYFSMLLEIRARKTCYCNAALMEYRVNHTGRISVDRDPRNGYFAVERLLNDLEATECRRLYPSIMLFLAYNVICEIMASEKEECNLEAYCAVQKLLENQMFWNPVTLEFYKQIVENFQNKTYESRWWQTIFFHDYQYIVHGKEIKSALTGYKKIILWGLGARGKAFQKFCRREGISLSGCTDIQNRPGYILTKYGVPVLHTAEASQCADLIVASNHAIYTYILKNIQGVSVIDLQDYEG
ncbi:MAG: glycosyltransferase family 2 protein [Lachnospiraceae bacterium]|nr:glycosyltransferase family 2 protein [Lachnospiraceae bacterium]